MYKQNIFNISVLCILFYKINCKCSGYFFSANFNYKKKYPELDFSKTERELTLELGYDRICDCGLFKYELIC